MDGQKEWWGGQLCGGSRESGGPQGRKGWGRERELEQKYWEAAFGHSLVTDRTHSEQTLLLMYLQTSGLYHIFWREKSGREGGKKVSFRRGCCQQPT